ncbi:MAG TPA: hypothetical protein VF635_02355 [Propionibacteriaceae bacterium]
MTELPRPPLLCGASSSSGAGWSGRSTLIQSFPTPSANAKARMQIPISKPAGHGGGGGVVGTEA